MKTFKHEKSILDGFTLGSHITNVFGQRGTIVGRYACTQTKTCSDCKVDKQAYDIITDDGVKTGWCWSLWRNGVEP